MITKPQAGSSEVRDAKRANRHGRSLVLAGVGVLMAGSTMANVWLFRLALDRERAVRALRLAPAETQRLPRVTTDSDATNATSRVVLLGDSRIAGWREPPQLADVQYINHGIAGQTTAQVQLRVDEVLRLRPDVVVIQVGINDLTCIAWLGADAPTLIDHTASRVAEVVERITAHDIRVVLLTVFQPGPVELKYRIIWDDQVRTAVVQVNKRLSSLASETCTVVDCNTVLAEGDVVRGRYAADTLHLSSEGYVALNAIVGPVLKQVLDRVDEDPDALQ